MRRLARVDRSVYYVRMTAKAPSELRPSAARDKILRTAHDLFYQEGIRATGIDRVISEAGVTKVTFYRHFPSKNDLVLAFLEYRHERWMAWFTDALARHASKERSPAQAIVRVMTEWFDQEDFRGCAFINTVVELGDSLPGTKIQSREHKDAMTAAILEILPPLAHRETDASAIAMAIDGAIVGAQYQGTDTVLTSLQRLLEPFT